jgi:hypothetical protein
MSDLTREEERWIASLRRLAAKRPSTLGVWGGSGKLAVIALTDNGGFSHDGSSLGSHHPEVVVHTGVEVNIPAGGGDPDWAYLDDIERPWVDGPESGAGQQPK